MGKKSLVIVFLLFVLAYFLRVMFLPKLVLTFGYDQARDAIIARQILAGDLKIQGPPASTLGLFHGVFYYYILAPGYLLGNGSPIIAAYWVACINALAIFVIFYLAYLLAGKKILPGFLAAFLFAISFESTQYATWLSNPTIAILTVPLMYLGLWLWLSERKVPWGPLLAALGLGLSIQSEIFLAYHIVPLAVWIFVGRKKITRREIFYFGVAFLASISSMIANEIKFGFRSIDGVKQLTAGTEANLAYAKSIGDYLILYLNQIGRIFAFNSYPGNIGYGGMFVIALAIAGLIKKQRSKMFLATWLFSHLTVVTVGGTSTPFLMVGIGPAVSIIIALFLFDVWKNKFRLATIAILAVLIYGNIMMIFRENKNGATLFSIQKDMLISKQLQAIDYTYVSAGKAGVFSINSVTSPLWINIVWTYLYNWYGEPKYGYAPAWSGKGQEGQLLALSTSSVPLKSHFLIVEPLAGIPTQFFDETISEENSRTKLIEEKYFGQIRVQKRLLK